MTEDSALEGALIVPKLFIETQHNDRILDLQFDFYGKRLATCAADGKIKVFDCSNAGLGSGALSSARLVSEVQASTSGPVWQVSWAHPCFGTVLASCGFDGRVIVWAEQEPPPAAWPGGARSRPTPGPLLQPIYEHRAHEPASVNAVAFAPPEYGLTLACAASDGRVSVCRRDERDGSWRVEWVADPATGIAHKLGATCLSWAPAGNINSTLAEQAADAAGTWSPMRLATGGCDHLVRIWIYDASSECWRIEGDGVSSPRSGELPGHTDWVRAVAWCPSRSAGQVLASAGQDGRVLIWRRVPSGAHGEAAKHDGGQWSYVELPRFKAPCWGLSWSTAGLFLAVSCGDQTVSLWRQLPSGEWKQIAEASEAGAQAIRDRERAQAQQELGSAATASTASAGSVPASLWQRAPSGPVTPQLAHMSPAVSPGSHPGAGNLVRSGFDSSFAGTGARFTGMPPASVTSQVAATNQVPVAGARTSGSFVPAAGIMPPPPGTTSVYAMNAAASGARGLPPGLASNASGMERSVPPAPAALSPNSTQRAPPAYGAAQVGAFPQPPPSPAAPPVRPAPPPPLPGIATPVQSNAGAFAGQAPQSSLTSPLMRPQPPPMSRSGSTALHAPQQVPAVPRSQVPASPRVSAASMYSGGAPPLPPPMTTTTTMTSGAQSLPSASMPYPIGQAGHPWSSSMAHAGTGAPIVPPPPLVAQQQQQQQQQQFSSGSQGVARQGMVQSGAQGPWSGALQGRQPPPPPPPPPPSSSSSTYR